MTYATAFTLSMYPVLSELIESVAVLIRKKLLIKISELSYLRIL